MLSDKASSNDVIATQVEANRKASGAVKGGGVFHVQCFDPEGNLKWETTNNNLVVNVGLKDMNDKYFSGSAYTAAWYVGLYGAGASNNPAAGDTAASHAGWTEVTAYSQATRPQAVFGAASTADPSVISNAGSPAVFTIDGSTTVGGAFLISNNTKGGSTGILFSAADFQAPGDRVLIANDIINVTYQFSLDAV